MTRIYGKEEKYLWQFSGFRSAVGEVAVLLGNITESLGILLPTFRETTYWPHLQQFSTSSSSSSSPSPFFFDI
jgi:hypothetical protein